MLHSRITLSHRIRQNKHGLKVAVPEIPLQRFEHRQYLMINRFYFLHWPQDSPIIAFYSSMTPPLPKFSVISVLRTAKLHQHGSQPRFHYDSSLSNSHHKGSLAMPKWGSFRATPYTEGQNQAISNLKKWTPLVTPHSARVAWIMRSRGTEKGR